MITLGRPETAVAQLLDILSRVFDYPNAWLLQSLYEGSFRVQLLDAFKRANLSVLSQQVDAVILGSSQTDIGSLESDYISLFEHNHEIPPIHLYSGLYSPRQGDRLSMLHDLTIRYRSYGLEREEGAEQLDHLSLMLEFLSFLYQKLSEIKEGDDQAQLQQEICSISKELVWAKQLSGGLHARGEHPFYYPSSLLLFALLRELQPTLFDPAFR